MIVAIFFFSIYAQLLTAIEFILEDHLWFPGGVSASKVPSYLCPWLDPVHFKVTLRAPFNTKTFCNLNSCRSCFNFKMIRVFSL
ncbi:hypothetical protein B0H13DRAFT_2055562 [Mycena leptocephala]|nr:hypothetical protein B0H13DRAFT_2055562 [Mycena leptocephala]